jgi:hypothetical protein
MIGGQLVLNACAVYISSRSPKYRNVAKRKGKQEKIQAVFIDTNQTDMLHLSNLLLFTNSLK